jgi:hypothetical protein
MRRRRPTRPLPLGVLLALAAGCAGSAPVGGGDGSMGGAAGTTTGSGGAGFEDGGLPPAPTFTWLYDNMFRGYCADRNQPCHNPGMNRGVSFASRDRAFDSVQFYVVPGDYLASDLYYFLSDGIMPPTNPRVPADLQAQLAAWIDAGALDD